MTVDSRAIRAAFAQQLKGDQLLGIRSVPMYPLARRCGRSGRVSESGARSGAVSDKARSVAGRATGGSKASQLRVLDDDEVKNCTKCELCQKRTNTVFGQGDPNARIVFVGEAPGYEEDRQGLAFVGRAGQLLTRMIAAMGLTRDEVFICNVLKCRPPGNRDPSAAEILACSPYLRRQLAIIEPEVLIALGAPAAKTLLNTAGAIGKLRGRFHDCHLSDVPGAGPSIPLMPTYHPAYLLRNPAEKRKAWEDLQLVMDRLGLR